MGRLRKDKGEKPKNIAPASSDVKKSKQKSKKDGKDSDILKKQVLALGGDEQDLELLRDVDDGAVNEHVKADKNLSKDVSKFLKELNFTSASDPVPKDEPTSASKKSKKAKAKESVNAAPKAQPRPDAAPGTSDEPASARKKAKKGETKEGTRVASDAGSKANSKVKLKQAPSELAEPGPSSKQSKKSQNAEKSKGAKKSEPAPSISTSTLLSAPLPAEGSTSTKSLFPPSPHWYTLLPTLPAPETAPSTPTAAQIATFTTRASTLLTSLNPTSSLSSTTTTSASDAAFLKTVLASGTLSDRLSALTLMAQSSPLHNTRALEALKGMAERGKGGSGKAKDGEKASAAGARAGGRDERLKAARAIVDWWVGGGAPDRKLKYFRDQPLLHPSATNQHLVLWYFEDWLKKYFFSVLQVLEALSLDPLPYVRTQAISLIATLLRDKPEQEHNLLRLLVNKLGDTEKAICSRASYHLLQLLQAHPRMKQIVIREMTALVLRPTVSAGTLSTPSTSSDSKPKIHIKFTDDAPAKSAPKEKPKVSATHAHARYYASITFNQIVLGTEEVDRAAARSLLDVYFALFREVVGERPDEVAPVEDHIEEEVEKKGKGKGKERSKGDYVKKKAQKVKEIRGAAGFAEVQDEHSRLVSAILTGVNRALPFAKLGGGDVEFDRHMDTLFLITHTSTFNIALQALTLIHHIVSALPASAPAVPRYYRTLYETLLDPRLYGSSKQALYLNLLFKSMKDDADAERVRAFVRRLCQVLVGGFGGVEFVAGGMWLLGELFNSVNGLRQMVDHASSVPSEKGADEEQSYDPRKRDPQYAHASSSPLWELTPLLNHYHPTISLLARQLLTHQPLTTSPDLALHTLTHFLDRFIYKNPKKVKPKGASAMQPVAAVEGEGVRKVRGEVQEGPVNVEGWWKKSEGSVPVDQLFFHRYFSQKHQKEQAMAAKVGKRKTKHDGDDAEMDSDADEDGEKAEEKEDDEEESDAEEAEIWKAMKASMPELAGGDDDDDLMNDSDSDEIPSGLDEDYSDSEPEFDAKDGPEGDEDEEEDADEGDADAFSLVEASDAEDLIDLDADAPDGLIDFDEDASDAEAEEWTGFGGETAGKRKRGKDDGEKDKRKKLRSLPTFASYEDYAKMIDDGVEDDI